MNYKEYIYTLFMKYKDVKRILIIGKAVDLFFEMYDGEFIEITDSKSLENFINKLIPYDKPLVFGDLSKINYRFQNRIFKIADELDTKLIAYAREDNIPDYILSRFEIVIKIPNTIKQTKSISLKEFINLKNNSDENFNIEQKSVELCPQYLYTLNSINDKIIDIFDEETIDMCIENLE